MQQKHGLYLQQILELGKPFTWDASVRSSVSVVTTAFGITRSLHALIFPKSLITLQTADGHIARLSEAVPANRALHCHVDISLGRPLLPAWKRRPGCPRNSWLEQVRLDSGSSPMDIWRWAVKRGHGATITAQAGYALMMMMMMIMTISQAYLNVLWLHRCYVCTYWSDHKCGARFTLQNLSALFTPFYTRAQFTSIIL